MSSVDSKYADKTSRIVTLRLYDGDKAYAQNHVETLVEFLKNLQQEYKFIVKDNYEKELSVYDTNVSHDMGWIHMNEGELAKKKVQTS